MLLVIDVNSVFLFLAHSIRSGNIDRIFPTEPEEIMHRISKYCYCVRAEHPDDKIVFACDLKPYWRSAFVEKHYTSRGEDVHGYKANRDGREWLFETPKEEMDRIFDYVLDSMAKSIGATIIKIKGLEADDIWGVLATQFPGEVKGFTTDSDWAQLVSSRVTVWNFAKQVYHEPVDIRLKWIGGDSGDYIKGCPKRKADGSMAKVGYGPKTAAKLLQQEDWRNFVDPTILEFNRQLTTLPCPKWDAQKALKQILSYAVKHEASDDHWDKFFVTATVRETLKDKVARDKFISDLRLQFLAKEQEADSQHRQSYRLHPTTSISLADTLIAPDGTRRTWFLDEERLEDD